ncbi:TfoX/Sxy family DNA transformation protein [Labrys neptuniae]
MVSEEELRRLGAVAAYRRLKFRFDHRVSLNALYAMQGALVDRDWRDVDREALRRLVEGR